MLKKRICAVILSIMMVFSLIPTSALAEGDEANTKDSKKPATVIQTADGEVEVGEDWVETYPYGTFAFGNYQADIAEKGALTEDGKEIPSVIRIPVYRVGGTSGKVTARILYTPATSLSPDGSAYLYDYAASGKNDVVIRYENPGAITQYQQYGMPVALRKMEPSAVSVVLEDPADDVAPEDDVNLVLSEDVAAESYQWQILNFGGWSNVKEANGNSFPTAWEDVWDFDEDCPRGIDYRCIYVIDGVWYCTESLFGENMRRFLSCRSFRRNFPM